MTRYQKQKHPSKGARAVIVDCNSLDEQGIKGLTAFSFMIRDLGDSTSGQPGNMYIAEDASDGFGSR